MCQAAGWQGTRDARQERAIPGHGKAVLPALVERWGLRVYLSVLYLTKAWDRVLLWC